MKEITNTEMLEMARLGAGVMQPRSVELGMKYHIPIHVRSTFTDEEGTIIREVCTMETRDDTVRGVAQDAHAARIAVLGLRPLPLPLTSTASPLTTSTGPKLTASLTPRSSAACAVISPTTSTLLLSIPIIP